MACRFAFIAMLTALLAAVPATAQAGMESRYCPTSQCAPMGHCLPYATRRGCSHWSCTPTRNLTSLGMLARNMCSGPTTAAAPELLLVTPRQPRAMPVATSRPSRPPERVTLLARAPASAPLGSWFKDLPGGSIASTPVPLEGSSTVWPTAI